MNGFFKLALAALAILGLTLGAYTARAADIDGKKPLIVYFSRSGNTAKVAENIRKLTGGEMIRIETVEPYPADYQTTTEVAKKEQETNARPPIKTKIANFDDYGVIFLGFPNWWSSLPAPVLTFIDENANLAGKTIAPFVTHGGGGMGNIERDLKKAAPNAVILKPFHIGGASASRSLEAVKRWLGELNIK